MTTENETTRPHGQDQEHKYFRHGLLNIKEVAQVLNVSKWTVYSLVKSDPTFPYKNVGVKKKFVVDSDELKAWTESRSKKLNGV